MVDEEDLYKDKQELEDDSFEIKSNENVSNSTWTSRPDLKIDRAELLKLINDNIKDLNARKTSLTPVIGVNLAIFGILLSRFTLMQRDLFFTDIVNLLLFCGLIIALISLGIITYKNYQTKELTSNQLYDQIEDISKH